VESQNITASRMILLTRLWHDETLEDGEADLGRLVELKYVAGKIPELSAVGRAIHGLIERETNHLTQPFFDILDDDSSLRFAEALGTLRT